MGDIHDCLSLGPGARKPARHKVTPLQCANTSSKLVIGWVCSDLWVVRESDCIIVVVYSHKVPEKVNQISG